MNESIFILKGNIVYSKNTEELYILEGQYLVCENGKVHGIYETLPDEYKETPVTEW